jgi:hypothetical protein
MWEVLQYVTQTTVAMERPQLTRARLRHTTIEVMMQALFSVGPLRDYISSIEQNQLRTRMESE